MRTPQLIAVSIQAMTVATGAFLDCLILGTSSYTQPSACDGNTKKKILIFFSKLLFCKIGEVLEHLILVHWWIIISRAMINCKLIDYLKHKNCAMI